MKPISFISRYDIKTALRKNSPLLSGAAIISINDTDKELEEMRGLIGKRPALFLKFKDDIKGEVITQEQCKAINDFIRKHRDKPFVVHCFAGISRSAAIAIHINNLLERGDATLLQYRSYNSEVLKVLGKSI